MTIGIASILNAVASHAKATAMFPDVLTHEPKSAPQGGTCAVFVTSVVPWRERSGLNAVSAVVTMTVRIYASMLQDPQDDIDRDLLVASDTLMTAYAGDFELGGSDREIDLLGMAATAGTVNGVQIKMGYINQDNKIFRIAEIQLPVIVNDVWTEAR